VDETSRRAALKVGGATLGAAAFARALAPLTEWEPGVSVDSFLQRHYKELDREELEAVLRRLEAETLAEQGVAVSISDPRPTPGVSFGYALNLSMCIGCRKCAEACHIENNHDRPTNNS
jgi:molybdopterin-containing oxidoreductase family iron-sulfur binding subunit